MISSIFGKTKPVVYIILLGFLFLFYWFVHYRTGILPGITPDLSQHILILGILLFSIFVVNFVVARNQITGAHSFAILYYTLLIAIFPEVLLDPNGILCSFFLLLSSRRLLSLRTLRSVKLKIFDASLWIAVGSLFYDWALLYLLIVFVAIYFYEPKNARNWMVPFISIIAVGLCLLSYLVLAGNLEFLSEHYRFELTFSPEYINRWAESTKLLIYTGVIILSGLLAFLNLAKLGQGKIITMRLLAISLIFGLAITLIKTADDVSPIILTFFPGAVLLANFVEIIKREKLRDAILLVSIAVPFVLLLTDSIIK